MKELLVVILSIYFAEITFLIHHDEINGLGFILITMLYSTAVFTNSSLQDSIVEVKYYIIC